jgi:hypothetical protein
VREKKKKTNRRVFMMVVNEKTWKNWENGENGFQVNYNEAVNGKTWSSPVENVNLSFDENGRKVVQRLLNKASDCEANVSKRYQVVTDSEITKAILDSGVALDIDHVLYHPKGGFSISSKTKNSKETLLLVDTNSWEVKRREIGDYVASMNVENSYNTSRAVKINGSINTVSGYVIETVDVFDNIRVKHYTWNRNKIKDQIKDMVDVLPELNKLNENSIEDMKNLTWDNAKRNQLSHIVHSYISRKRKTKSVKNNENYQSKVDFFEKYFNTVINSINNQFDYSCVISDLKKYGSFIASMCVVVNNQYKKKNK